MAAEFDYVFFPWWPEDGDEWLRPDGVDVARRLIPGRRVFLRSRESDEWTRYAYGDESFFAKPALSIIVKGEGIRVGDFVEVCFRLGAQSLIAEVREMQYSLYHDCIEYRLKNRDLLLERRFTSAEFRRLDPAHLPDPDPEVLIAPPSDPATYRLIE